MDEEPNISQMVFYAMPCASVLLLELFRQCSQPQQEVILNKSTIIKDLYALISSCDMFTESGQSNYEMCKQAQSIFTRGLDHILDRYDQSQSTTMQDDRESTKQHYHSLGGHDMGNTDDFVLDPEWNAWLESFGLESNRWLDFTPESLDIQT